MEMIAPSGPVYQAGTLSGNPLAMAAGIAQLKSLQTPGTYAHLEQNTTRLAEGLKGLSKSIQVVSVPGMLGLFFSSKPVTDFASAQKCDTELFGKVWRALIEKGIYWPPSQFEAAFISTVHTKNDIDNTIEAFKDSLK
jgi:glutamate-1-semialdehyde 2,1-aminomutase